MKYLKLFEDYAISRDEFPFDGNDLSKRERGILSELVGGYYIKFNTKKDDGYYYTYSQSNFTNRFDNLNDLKDYIEFYYFMDTNDGDGFIKILNKTNLNMSFDKNYAIRWASYKGYTKIVKLLLADPRVDPSDDDNYAIKWARKWDRERGHKEIVKLLLNDERVRAKLSSEEINKYLNEIS